jgi:hypothetical protein
MPANTERNGCCRVRVRAFVHCGLPVVSCPAVEYDSRQVEDGRVSPTRTSNCLKELSFVRVFVCFALEQRLPGDA